MTQTTARGGEDPASGGKGGTLPVVVGEGEYPCQWWQGRVGDLCQRWQGRVGEPASGSRGGWGDPCQQGRQGLPLLLEDSDPGITYQQVWAVETDT